MTRIDESLAGLIHQLSEKISKSDFLDLRDACKDDDIDDADLKKLSSPKELLEFLCEKKLLSQEDPSFIEHVFELCRRPDLLTIVMEYRMSNLGIENEADLGRKLVRVCSAKKYIDTSELKDQAKEALTLSDPPKTRKKSSSTR